MLVFLNVIKCANEFYFNKHSCQYESHPKRHHIDRILNEELSNTEPLTINYSQNNMCSSTHSRNTKQNFILPVVDFNLYKETIFSENNNYNNNDNNDVNVKSFDNVSDRSLNDQLNISLQDNEFCKLLNESADLNEHRNYLSNFLVTIPLNTIPVLSSTKSSYTISDISSTNHINKIPMKSIHNYSYVSPTKDGTDIIDNSVIPSELFRSTSDKPLSDLPFIRIKTKKDYTFNKLSIPTKLFIGQNNPLTFNNLHSIDNNKYLNDNKKYLNNNNNKFTYDTKYLNNNNKFTYDTKYLNDNNKFTYDNNKYINNTTYTYNNSTYTNNNTFTNNTTTCPTYTNNSFNNISNYNKIQEIQIDNNNLKYLSNDILKFRNLKIIEINSTNFISYNCLGKLPSLKKVVIGQINLDKIDESIFYLQNLKYFVVEREQCEIDSSESDEDDEDIVDCNDSFDGSGMVYGNENKLSKSDSMTYGSDNMTYETINCKSSFINDIKTPNHIDPKYEFKNVSTMDANNFNDINLINNEHIKNKLDTFNSYLNNYKMCNDMELINTNIKKHESGIYKRKEDFGELENTKDKFYNEGEYTINGNNYEDRNTSYEKVNSYGNINFNEMEDFGNIRYKKIVSYGNTNYDKILDHENINFNEVEDHGNINFNLVENDYNVLLNKDISNTSTTSSNKNQSNETSLNKTSLINENHKKRKHNLFFKKNEFKQLEYLKLITLQPSNNTNLLNIKTLPKELFYLENLQMLIINNQKIKTIPPNIGNLKNLKIINLSNNLISFLPESFYKLKLLKTVRLSNNELKIISPKIKYLENIQRLELSDNMLTTIPFTIGTLKNLRLLNLSDNQLLIIPSSIGNLKSLTYINLSFNYIIKMPSSIGKLIELKYLIFKNVHPKCIHNNLSKLINLVEIDFHHTIGFREFKNYFFYLNLDFKNLIKLRKINLMNLKLLGIHKSLIQLKGKVDVMVNDSLDENDYREYIGIKTLKDNFFR